MKKQEQHNGSRRKFLQQSLTAAAGFYIIPRHVMGRGFVAPSDKLIIAGIGAGGKGASDVDNFMKSGKAEIAFLCDVDDRQAANTRKKFPNAKYYKDYRELLDKEHKNFDACNVSTPDHMHAVIAMAAMRQGKHVYVQKPMAHDIYEARMMTQAAHKYNVVTQMGNQGASGDGVRQLREWFNAGTIGTVNEVYVFTNRPVWPQGGPWPKPAGSIPSELDWNLWQGTAPSKDYVDGLLPFNWRGWWDYGTGALGDMGCHLMEAPFRVLGLSYPTAAECSVASFYDRPWTPVFEPAGCPISSHVTITFAPTATNHSEIKMHWMDGGIQPTRPEELGPSEEFGGDGGGNGVLFIGSKGKMMCTTYGQNPRLLPTSRMNDIKVPQTIARVPKGETGHYISWVEACIAGPGSQQAKDLSSNFDLAGPLTEIVIMGNLAIRSYNLTHKVMRKNKQNKDEERTEYPGRNIKLLWDGANMKVTNFAEANQFVRREYREPYKLVG